MPSLSTTLILKSLDCLTVRSQVTAHNIANANTPGYRPLRVTFEQALSGAAVRGKAAVKALEPQIGPDASAASSNGLRLDVELTTASATALRYAALIEILNRRSQGDAMAISGNV